MQTDTARSSSSDTRTSLFRPVFPLAGVAFVVLVIVQNAALAGNAPQFDASVDEIAKYYSENTGTISIAIALVMINLPLLLWFGTGVISKIWSRIDLQLVVLPLGCLFLLAATFLATTVLQITLVLNEEGLADNASVTNILFDLHNAAFVANMTALGLTLASFSFAAARAGLMPGWTAWLGVAGGLALVASAMPSVDNLNGGPGLFVGFAGFIVWLLWVLFISVRTIMLGEPEQIEG